MALRPSSFPPAAPPCRCSFPTAAARRHRLGHEPSETPVRAERSNCQAWDQAGSLSIRSMLSVMKGDNVVCSRRKKKVAVSCEAQGAQVFEPGRKAGRSKNDVRPADVLFLNPPARVPRSGQIATSDPAKESSETKRRTRSGKGLSGPDLERRIQAWVACLAPSYYLTLLSTSSASLSLGSMAASPSPNPSWKIRRGLSSKTALATLSRRPLDRPAAAPHAVVGQGLGQDAAKHVELGQDRIPACRRRTNTRPAPCLGNSPGAAAGDRRRYTPECSSNFNVQAERRSGNIQA